MDQDLRTLLTSVRDDAPPPRLSVDDITAAGRHLARRRRRLALLSTVGGGALAAVAAVTAALVFVVSPTAPLTPAVDPSTLPNMAASPPGPTAFAEARPFVTTYRGYEAGSYVVSDPDLVTNAYQQSSIDIGAEPAEPTPKPSASAQPATMKDRPGLLRGGILVVYRPGAFEPALFLKSSEKISLRSGVGLLHYAGGMTAPTLSSNDRARLEKSQPEVPTIAWQYSSDAWAAIYWTSWETVPERDSLVAIAEGLTPATAREFPVGFDHGYLPPGYQLVSASYGADLGYGSRVVSVVRLSPALPKVPLTAPYDFEALPSMTIAVGRTDGDPKSIESFDCPDSTSCSRVVDDGSAYVTADLNGLKVTAAVQLAQVTLGIKPLDLEDMSDWPPAVKIFP
jgi:hypothetical protein